MKIFQMMFSFSLVALSVISCGNIEMKTPIPKTEAASGSSRSPVGMFVRASMGSKVILDTNLSPNITLQECAAAATLNAFLVFDDNSTEDVTDRTTWQTSNPLLGTIAKNANGATLLQGVRAGNVVATATYKMAGIDPFGVTFNVTNLKLVNILTVPGTVPTLQVGKSANLSLLVIYEDDSYFDITSSLTFTSDDPTIAVFNSPTVGRFTVVGTGQVQLRFSGKVGHFTASGSVPITVQ